MGAAKGKTCWYRLCKTRLPQAMGGSRELDAQNATLYYLNAFREAGDIADELVDIACATEGDTPPGEETDEAASSCVGRFNIY